MVIEIKIPGVGESVREAVLAQWLKNDGDAVKKDEPILVIETDKVSLEVAAEADGVLHIQVPAGTTVPIGAVVGTLAVDEGAETTAPTPLPSSSLLHLAPGVQSPEPPIPAPSQSPQPSDDARLSAPPAENSPELSQSLVHDATQLLSLRPAPHQRKRDRCRCRLRNRTRRQNHQGGCAAAS